MKALIASRAAMLAVTPQQHRAPVLPSAQPLLRVLQTSRTPTQLSLFSTASRSVPSAARLASPVLRTSTS